MRIDRCLFEKGFAESRTKASAMIADGIVFCNGKQVTKASFDVPDDAVIELRGQSLAYVSRGGLKMEGALNAFCLDVAGMVALDFGASTGGFTDCLLQRGCQKVYAIDSGSDQLHERLRSDSRVISLENRNARYLTFDDIGEYADLAVCDLSFISQTLLHFVIASLLKHGGIFISLIKPQFEVGREGLGKGGIVKNEKMRMIAVDKVVASAESVGFALQKIIPSPITGGDGNLEYLAYFIKNR